MNALVIFIVGLTAVSAQAVGDSTQWYCQVLSNENCDHDGYLPRCGTDGVTYYNMCYISKAHCGDQTIDQKHEGPCTSSEAHHGPTTTFSPDQLVKGNDLLMSINCIILGRQPCTHQINEKICGTDGVTYEDFCEYEKARCTHRDLHVQKMGDCNA